MRRLLTIAVILALPIATQGCAAVLLGYVVADGINRDKATATCRAQLKITNDQRAHEGKDLFPDQCAQ